MIEIERDAPDLEDLAAYIDGRLAGERKAQVEERLLHDEDYYDVFRENVEFLQEHGPQEIDGAEVVRPAVWSRFRNVIAPLGIAATLVLTLGTWQLRLGPSTSEWVAHLDAGMVAASGKDWDDPGWSRSRGGSSPDQLQLDLQRRQELAFRIGTRTVDLRIALTADDRDAASRAAGQIERWAVDEMTLLGIGGYYAELKDQVFDRELGSLGKRADELEELMAHRYEGSPADRYNLGRWNEAGRLASLARDAEMLRGIWRRRYAARGIGEIKTHIKDLKAALKKSEPDFERAARAFSEIAEELAGRD